MLKGYWLTAGLDSAMYREKMTKRGISHHNRVLFGFIDHVSSENSGYCFIALKDSLTN